MRVFIAWLALMTLAAPAAAETGFVWDAPTTCPDAADVRERIARRMPADAAIHGIEVAIAREEGRFVARIDTRGVTLANQVRTVTSARCDELADAVAVIVARLAGEARVASEAKAKRVASVTDVETPPGRGRVVVKQIEPSAQPSHWGGGLRALATSGIGALPGVGVGGELAVFARRRDKFAELVGARWARSAMFLSEGAPAAVGVSLETLGLRAGWSPPNMYIRAWLGIELGAMTGAGIRLTDPQIGSARWTAATGGFGVAWPMSRYSRLVGTIEAVVPLAPVRFVLADRTEIYQPSPAGARCSLGLELGWR